MAGPSGDLGGGGLDGRGDTGGGGGVGGGGDTGGGGGVGGDPSGLDGGVDPIPYPEIDGLEHEPVRDVKIDGDPATTTTSLGDEPGMTKDIASFEPGTDDATFPPVGSVDVRFESGVIVRGPRDVTIDGPTSVGSGPVPGSDEGEKEPKERSETVQIEEEGGSSFWDPSSRYPDETDGFDPMPDFGTTFEPMDAVDAPDVTMEKDAFFDFDG